MLKKIVFSILSRRDFIAFINCNEDNRLLEIAIEYMYGFTDNFEKLNDNEKKVVLDITKKIEFTELEDNVTNEDVHEIKVHIEED